MRTTLKIILPSTGDVVPRSNLNPAFDSIYFKGCGPERRFKHSRNSLS